MDNDIIILAAGKGTRMRSLRAKVLQTLAGRPLLQHVIDTAKTLDNSHLHVVIGHDAEQVKSSFNHETINWIEQQQQLGTGHAVKQALPAIKDKGISLVLYGDVPLVSASTLENLIAQVDANSMAVLSVDLENPKGYGRILRDEQGHVVAIVEEKDANEQQRLVKECNSGIIAIHNSLLKHYIDKISNDNAQKEYYLTDLIGLLAADGKAVYAIKASSEAEVQGVNDKKQLAQLERSYQHLLADKLLLEGVTLLDPARIDIRGSVQCGQDVSIDVNCVFLGEVIIADEVSIGPNCVIGSLGKTVTIGRGCEIKANCIIEEAVIAENAVIGPFARLRPGTTLEKNTKIGNFVETKKSHIGEGSKVNHLSYIGDSQIGKNVNIGAGTITCNYDGVNKFNTIIDDEVFVGSNTSLVAPLNIGKSATIGAGSTITSNVSDNELAVGRGKQRNIQNWIRPQKK